MLLLLSTMILVGWLVRNSLVDPSVSRLVSRSVGGNSQIVPNEFAVYADNGLLLD